METDDSFISAAKWTTIEKLLKREKRWNAKNHWHIKSIKIMIKIIIFPFSIIIFPTWESEKRPTAIIPLVPQRPDVFVAHFVVGILQG